MEVCSWVFSHFPPPPPLTRAEGANEKGRATETTKDATAYIVEKKSAAHPRHILSLCIMPNLGIRCRSFEQSPQTILPHARQLWVSTACACGRSRPRTTTHGSGCTGGSRKTPYDVRIRSLYDVSFFFKGQRKESWGARRKEAYIDVNMLHTLAKSTIMSFLLLFFFLFDVCGHFCGEFTLARQEPHSGLH